MNGLKKNKKNIYFEQSPKSLAPLPRSLTKLTVKEPATAVMPMTTTTTD